MTEHTPTPWFTNRKFEVGPRPRTDDRSDGMLHPVADVFGDNAKDDAAFIVKACNSHDALVKALTDVLKLQDSWIAPTPERVELWRSALQSATPSKGE